jgi:hypothetical protein
MASAAGEAESRVKPWATAMFAMSAISIVLTGVVIWRQR